MARASFGRIRARVTPLCVVALFLLALPHTGSGQAASVLRISVALVDADQRRVPVPRHALLVSDNPPTSTPRRVVTALDGTVTVRLPPGNYTVESDRPLAFQGQEYVWTQTLDVAAGGEAVLELTADNAEVGPLTAASAPAPGRKPDVVDALLLWQDSVVALWTPTTNASAVVVDARGLVVTSQQVVATATSVEVQLTPAVKVRGQVLVADRENDVAVLWIDPAEIASIKPVPLGCAPAPAAPLANGQEVVALGIPAGQQIRTTYGIVNRVASRAMLADFALPRGSAGGPVFIAGGRLVGITSFVVGKEGNIDEESRVVRADAVCDVVASAAAKMKGAAPPSGTRLPVEPSRAVPVETLDVAAKGRAGSLSPYQVSSADFDVAFLTPLQTRAAMRSTMDFGNWHEYIADVPSVLLVRATPKQAENRLLTLARGVALLKGMALPAITSFKSGFSRMRARCGDAEVTPIHPFLLERRVSETEAIYEGLYVFDPEALGPHCSAVTLELFSEKTPAKADTVVVPPAVVQQIWSDFVPYRALQ